MKSFGNTSKEMDLHNLSFSEDIMASLQPNVFDYAWTENVLIENIRVPENQELQETGDMIDNSVSTTVDVHQPQFQHIDVGAATEYPMAGIITPELEQNEASTSLMDAPISSLPAANNWLGDWDFDVYFEQKSPSSNSTSWTYSHIKDKLYVKKDAPCPIRFVTNGHVPIGAYIRAKIVFSQAQFVAEVVKRCFTHASKDAQSHLANYVLRSECHQHYYEEDPYSKQHSVIVQYENPQSGATDSTYVYSFACWGSCAGGINRRPLKLIFTLEHGGKQIGRRTIDLRICACPARDRVSDEKDCQHPEEKADSSRKAKRKVPNEEVSDNVATVLSLLLGPANKKAKSEHTPPPGPYNIRVNEYDTYLFLKRMKTFYSTFSSLTRLAPQIRQFLVQSSVKSESSEEKGFTDDSE